MGERQISGHERMPTTANLSKAAQEHEEVVPVNVSTWVLPSGVTVGR